MQNIFSSVKNSSLLSLRGFEKSEVIHSIYNFFKNWIATPLLRSARNDNYFYSSLRGIGNAEAIKFTFDSLSRKVKNPCLVINKFIIGVYSHEEYQNNFNRSIIVYALVFGKL